MTDRIDDLIHKYLDETLTASEHDELATQIKSDPQVARRLAEVACLHDRLRNLVSLDQDEQLSAAQKPAINSASPARRSILSMVTAACLLLGAGLIFWKVGSTPAIAAAAELQRIIEANSTLESRTYRISSLDSLEDEDLPVRGGQKPPLDGALLHVRGSEEYVLERFFSDGTRFITGSDGQIAWAIPPRGRVRVSRDPERFRGVVPGQQHSIPFIDMRASLEQLADAYELRVDQTIAEDGTRQLNGSRRSDASGGPKEVTIWYDAESGVIQRMQLSRLPRNQGGPRSVVLELVEQREMNDEFFQHSSHHSPDREVIEDER